MKNEAAQAQMQKQTRNNKQNKKQAPQQKKTLNQKQSQSHWQIQKPAQVKERDKSDESDKSGKSDKITIAYRIKTLREYKNLTQEELAERAGYHDKSSISKIENSGDNISLKKVNKIAEALDVLPSKLLGDDETDTRIQVLADAAEKDREKIPQELRDKLDKFNKLLRDYKKDLDHTRKLVDEIKKKDEYKELTETFDDAMDQLESKSDILGSLLGKLESTIKYSPSTEDIPDAPEDTGD